MQSLGRAGSGVPAKAHCSLVFKVWHFAGNKVSGAARVLLQEPGHLLPSFCYYGPRALAAPTPVPGLPPLNDQFEAFIKDRTPASHGHQPVLSSITACIVFVSIVAFSKTLHPAGISPPAPCSPDMHGRTLHPSTPTTALPSPAAAALGACLRAPRPQPHRDAAGDRATCPGCTQQSLLSSPSDPPWPCPLGSTTSRQGALWPKP